MGVCSWGMLEFSCGHLESLMKTPCTLDLHAIKGLLLDAPDHRGSCFGMCVCVCVYFVSENKTTKTTHICNKNGVLGDH